MKLRTDFEGGRIELMRLDGRRVTLRVPHDVGAAGFRQHFAFDLVDAVSSRPVELCIENAARCTWAEALGTPYRVYASHDARRWFCLDTRYEDGKLWFDIRPRAPRIRFAYHPLYPSSRLRRLLAAAREAGIACEQLARTPGGRPIHHLVFGTRRARAGELWILAQQHPGESMAGWCAEGLVEALLEETLRASDPRRSRGSRDARPAQAASILPRYGLLERARVHLVPCMNPDGIAVGNHRTTPRGVDLNRAWNDPRAPIEVASVRAAMERSGARLLVDLHGDERLPYVFLQPADDFAGRPEGIRRTEQRLDAAMLAASTDFQTEHRYTYDAHGSPNLQLVSNWAQQRFGCAAFVLEMPFSDNAAAPDPRGWHPARSKQLGRALARALAACVTANA